MASLGRPVEPEVHSQNPGDSSQVGVGSPSARSGRRVQLVSESHSGDPVTTTVSTSGAAARIASTSPAALGRDDGRRGARLSATMAPRSRPGSSGFTGAATAPMRIAARKTS